MSRDRIIQLQESAESLGFETIQEALDAGYHEVQDLVRGEFKLEKVEDLTNRAYREAHEERERERTSLLKDLADLQETLESLADGEPHQVSSYWADTVWHAIEFIKEGEI